MKKNTILTLLILLSVPAVSFAADGLTELLNGIYTIVKMIFPFMFFIGVLYFFWGMGQFILHDAGNDKTRADGQQKMLWGIIALFVMASILGILKFIGTSVGIDTSDSIKSINQ